MKALFVASSGGHLNELAMLRERIPNVEQETWVTFEGPQASTLLLDRRVRLVEEVAPRDWRAAARAVPAARQIIREERPDIVVSTGAAVALPYLAVSAAARIPTFYVESAARRSSPSMTGRIVGHIPGVTNLSQSAHMGRRWHCVGSVFDAYSAIERGTPASARLRVLVLLGTMAFPFNRLAQRIAAVLPPDTDVFWQLGNTPAPEGLRGELVRFMSSSALAEELDACDVVITHAGVGSTLTALQHGHMPIVVPRRALYGEHVDDHQVETAEALAAEGIAIHREADDLLAADIHLVARRLVKRLERPAPVLLPGVANLVGVTRAVA